MVQFTVHEAADILAARLIGPGEGAFRGVCTDTRTGAGGALFVALRGESADGHAYVARALEAGAAAAVVERPVPDASGTQLVVPDALRALGLLARAWRRRNSATVVGVTGSVGKTSTREMTAAALGGEGRVLANRANFNNEIGVPQTLFGLNASHEAAVIEMAMRGAGQVAWLAEVAEPAVGVVTNVGWSHIELLGSREAIAAAKGELVEALPAGGTAVLNGDDALCRALAGRAACRVLTFGVAAPADFRAQRVEFAPDGSSRFVVNGTPVEVRAPGVHHVVNAAAAMAVASVLGVEAREAAQRIEAFRAPAMRMEVAEAPNGITVLNDAYNAAPDSMRAAVETLALLAGGRRRSVAVLGDMRELGAFGPDGHAYVGEVVAERGIAMLVTVGAQACAIAAAARPRLAPEQVTCFPDTEAAAAAAPGLLEPGDIVLVKGSRAMEMERIVSALTGEDTAAH